MKKSIAIVALVLGACVQKMPEKAEGAPSTPSAQIVTPEWVNVAQNSDNKAVYVNKTSIFPYKDMKMVEVAMEKDEKNYDAQSFAFNCGSRLVINLGMNGSVSDPAPVQSWLINSSVFNYVCFNHLSPSFEGKPHQASLNVTSGS